jgi:GDP-4-dehydro-6-deoxy-D-mannose reductase
MSRILLTGANGFVGKVLHRRLLREGHEVFGTVGSLPTEQDADLRYTVLDICDRANVDTVIQQINPTHLVHLAAISNVAISFKDPLLTWNTNVMGTMNLLESLKAHAPDCFTLFVSSSEVYGESFKSGSLLDEEAPCAPMNPYAASKLAAEISMLQYLRQGMNGVIVRPFNHIGPGQSADFVTGSFAKQIAAIEAGLQSPAIKVGNLDASRDFLSVDDVCDAYAKFLSVKDGKLDHLIYNISSGASKKIQAMLDELLKLSSLAIEVQTDPDRLRPSDIPVAAGSNSRIRNELGWAPTTLLSETLESILADWRRQMATAPAMT